MAKQNKKAVRTATKSGGGKGPDAEQKLDGLAADIRAGHRRCVDAMKGVVEQARDIGKALEAAKGMVRHGEWTGWVADHCQFAMRMAQNYLLVARHYSEVVAKWGKADEWRLTEFLAVAQELDRTRRGKAAKTPPAEPAAGFGLPADEVALRRDRLRDRPGTDRLLGDAAVTAFVRQKLDALYAAVRRFAASKATEALAGAELQPADIGILLVESLKAALDPTGLVAAPAAAEPATPPTAPAEPAIAPQNRHTANHPNLDPVSV